MPPDPIAAQFPRRTRARVWIKRVASWRQWALLGAMIAVVALALGLVANARSSAADGRSLRAAQDAAKAAQASAAEAKARTQQLQDAFCGKGNIPGLLPTILQAKVPPTASQLGKNLVIGAHFAAQTVHCPGVK